MTSSFFSKEFDNTHLVMVAALRQVRVRSRTRWLDPSEDGHHMILHNLDLDFLAKLDNLLKNSSVPCCSPLLIVNDSPAKRKSTSFNFHHSSRWLPHLDHFCLCQRR